MEFCLCFVRSLEREFFFKWYLVDLFREVLLLFLEFVLLWSVVFWIVLKMLFLLFLVFCFWNFWCIFCNYGFDFFDLDLVCFLWCECLLLNDLELILEKLELIFDVEDFGLLIWCFLVLNFVVCLLVFCFLFVLICCLVLELFLLLLLFFLFFKLEFDLEFVFLFS